MELNLGLAVLFLNTWDWKGKRKKTREVIGQKLI
jgi:hypothetical protein